MSAPGREHDTTCAKAATELALEQAASEGMPTLTDLGYEGLAGSALRTPAKKAKGAEYSNAQKQYNLIFQGLYGTAERANSLLETTFKVPRRVSMRPWRIGAIARAAHVLPTSNMAHPCPLVAQREDPILRIPQRTHA